MKMHNSNLIYALKNNEIVHISEVENGLACDCVCPSCGEKLVAKKGDKVVHHFAHKSNLNCEYGYETSLHMAAKKIIENAEKMIIPAVVVSFPKSYKRKITITEPKEVAIQKVQLEQTYGCLIPDIVVHSMGQIFFVEIYVTHKVDEEKIAKLRNANISTIEIDLSKMDQLVTEENLKTYLLGEVEEKVWIYNRAAHNWYNRFLGTSKEYNCRYDKFAHEKIKDCPLRKIKFPWKHSADVFHDCLYCEFCIEYPEHHEGIVLCNGESLIDTIDDFSKPLKERYFAYKKKIQQQREDDVEKWSCPRCNNCLEVKDGKNGKFIGCSNYPYCKFTASINEETGEILMDYVEQLDSVLSSGRRQLLAGSGKVSHT